MQKRGLSGQGMAPYMFQKVTTGQGCERMNLFLVTSKFWGMS